MFLIVNRRFRGQRHTTSIIYIWTSNTIEQTWGKEFYLLVWYIIFKSLVQLMIKHRLVIQDPPLKHLPKKGEQVCCRATYLMNYDRTSLCPCILSPLMMIDLKYNQIGVESDYVRLYIYSAFFTIIVCE